MVDENLDGLLKLCDSSQALNSNYGEKSIYVLLQDHSGNQWALSVKSTKSCLGAYIDDPRIEVIASQGLPAWRFDVGPHHYLLATEMQPTIQPLCLLIVHCSSKNVGKYQRPACSRTPVPPSSPRGSYDRGFEASACFPNTLHFGRRKQFMRFLARGLAWKKCAENLRLLLRARLMLNSRNMSVLGSS